MRQNKKIIKSSLLSLALMTGSLASATGLEKVIAPRVYQNPSNLEDLLRAKSTITFPKKTYFSFQVKWENPLPDQVKHFELTLFDDSSFVSNELFVIKLDGKLNTYHFRGYKENNNYTILIKAVGHLGEELSLQVGTIKTDKAPYLPFDSNMKYFSLEVITYKGYTWAAQGQIGPNGLPPSLADVDGSDTGWNLDNWAVRNWIEGETYDEDSYVIFQNKLFVAKTYIGNQDGNPLLNSNWEQVGL